MSPALQAIERRRLALNMSRTELERAANLPASYYSSFLMAGKRTPRPATIAKLSLALDNVARRRGGVGKYSFAVAAAYRFALIVAAQALGHDPINAQSQDPRRRATQCPDWMEASDVRRLALYLLTSECGFMQSDVARAAGVRKQTVSEAVADLEAVRDEGSAFEAMVDTLRDWIMGDLNETA